jgi:hypothetical protein
VVHGQTVKYNAKTRLGRGFTVAELKVRSAARPGGEVRAALLGSGGTACWTAGCKALSAWLWERRPVEGWGVLPAASSCRCGFQQHVDSQELSGAVSGPVSGSIRQRSECSGSGSSGSQRFAEQPLCRCLGCTAASRRKNGYLSRRRARVQAPLTTAVAASGQLCRGIRTSGVLAAPRAGAAVGAGVGEEQEQ